MQLIFELSGEHDTLPRSEVIAVLEAYEIDFNILVEEPGVLIIDSPTAIKTLEMILNILKKRLALTRGIYEGLFTCDVNEINTRTKEINVGEGSIAVRAKRIQNMHGEVKLIDIERNIGKLTKSTNTVDLKNPDVEIKVLLSKKGHVGVKKIEIDRGVFETRKVQNRHFFSPISLHPRLARTLVNLSRVKEGEMLLDPFCGTGGILIEAGLIGVKPIGSDIDARMIQGCRQNLEDYGIEKTTLFQSEVGDVKGRVEKVDAIVTDPPYGRSSSTAGEKAFSLYERAFKIFNEILTDGKYLAIVLPDKKSIEIGEELFTLSEVHPQRVHRSLTRYFCVFQ